MTHAYLFQNVICHPALNDIDYNVDTLICSCFFSFVYSYKYSQCMKYAWEAKLESFTHFQDSLSSPHSHVNTQMKTDTVNDLFSASALVTAPYLFSKQYTWQLLVGDRSDSDSAQSRLVIKGY